MTKYKILYVGEDGMEHRVDANSVSVELNGKDGYVDGRGRLSRVAVLRAMKIGESMVLPYRDDKDYVNYRSTASYVAKLFGSVFHFRRRGECITVTRSL